MDYFCEFFIFFYIFLDPPLMAEFKIEIQEGISPMKIKFKEYYLTEYNDIHRAVADKIKYHWMDVACCLTCVHVANLCDDMLECLNTRYREDKKDVGEDNEFNWWVEPVGLCDNYAKRIGPLKTWQN
jgi:hypothetical protein